MEDLYNDLIEELGRRIRIRKKDYLERVERREIAARIQTILDNHSRGVYPEIGIDTDAAEAFKQILGRARVQISEEDYDTLLTAFKKMNYYNKADKEIFPIISKRADYINTLSIIDTFFSTYSNILSYYSLKITVPESDLLARAKDIERFVYARKLLGENGFTEVMSKEKIDKLFAAIDAIDNDRVDQYKTLILYRALIQDKALHKVSVKRADKPIEDMTAKTIEEEQVEAHVIDEVKPVESDEDFTIDDLSEMLFLDFQDENTKKEFFDAFDKLINDKTKLNEMLDVAKEFCNEQMELMKKYNLAIDTYDERQKTVHEYFNSDAYKNEFGDSFIYFKNALWIMQELSELNEDINLDGEDKLSILSIFASLYAVDRVELKDGLKFVDDEDDDFVEVLEDDDLVQENRENTKKIYFLDPDVFESAVSGANMDLRDRKKIATIMNDLIDDTNLGSRHPYGGNTTESAATLKEFGAWVAKKGGKTRAYFSPIKNSDNEIVANIVILPCVTSKDHKKLTNEEIDAARLLQNNRDRFNELKSIILQDINSPLLDGENAVTDRLLGELNNKLSKSKSEGGVKR